MNDERKDVLLRLLQSAGPSGFEEPTARIWRAEAERFADEVWVDSAGNSFARLRGDGPVVVVEGHIDEIGLMVTYIDDEGFVWFEQIGGLDDQILTGQRVRIIGRGGPVAGVIGRKPAHLLSADERSRASKAADLWIDLGAAGADEARAQVAVGDPIVLEQPPLQLPHDLLVARGLDNRVGAWCALEVLRLLAANRPPADVYALAVTQEEIGMAGARVSAFALNPAVAIATDVTHATDYPETNKRRQGNIRLGAGPVLARGSAISPVVFERLIAAATEEGIPYQVEVAPQRSYTDADVIAPARGGVPTGLVSFPNRYMHSPNEMVSLADLDAAVRLIAGFVQRLGSAPDFRRA